MTRFLSNEWIELAKDVATKNLDPEKDLNNATASLLNIINNIPPNNTTLYLYISVENGNLKEMLIDKNESILEKDAEFIVSGNYDTFTQIFKGEMSTSIALIKNRLTIKGDKIKAMKFIKPINRLNSCLKKIDTEF